MEKRELFIISRLIQKWLNKNEENLSLYVCEEFIKQTAKKTSSEITREIRRLSVFGIRPTRSIGGQRINIWLICNLKKTVGLNMTLKLMLKK